MLVQIKLVGIDIELVLVPEWKGKSGRPLITVNNPQFP